MNGTFIIGIAGGSGSGKTTVTNYIIDAVGIENVQVIRQDYYYKDLSHLSLDSRRKVNFDHPDAFDWQLLKDHINKLHNGTAIDMPVHDYVEYIRKKDTVLINPCKIIIFEGIFALMEAEIYDLMSLKIFVDTAADIRFIRRLKRDIHMRGRTTDSVIEQYSDFVRPMHKKFIEPTKRHSHIIIPHGVNRAALETIVARVKAALNNDNLLNNNNLWNKL